VGTNWATVIFWVPESGGEPTPRPVDVITAIWLTFGAAALHVACAPALKLCRCSPQVLFAKLDLQLAPLGNMHF
jgi:hypothetical protein